MPLIPRFGFFSYPKRETSGFFKAGCVKPRRPISRGVILREKPSGQTFFKEGFLTGINAGFVWIAIVFVEVFHETHPTIPLSLTTHTLRKRRPF